MRILFDTNVIMDFIVKREPFSGIAEAAIPDDIIEEATKQAEADTETDSMK